MRTNKPTLIGHNVAFDLARMRRLFTDHRKDPAKCFAMNSGEFLSICTLQTAVRKMRRPPLNYDGAANLTALCAHFGIPLLNAHGAMADTEATMRLYEALQTPMSAEKPGSDFAEKPKVKKRKPFQI